MTREEMLETVRLAIARVIEGLAEVRDADLTENLGDALVSLLKAKNNIINGAN